MRTRGKRWRRVAAAAVIAGASTPAVLRWVRRTGAARRAVDLRMTLVISLPVVEVFEFCRDFENFPRLFNGLVEVRDSQDGRSRWEVRSPTGERIEWDSVVTKYVPSTVIAWQAVPGAPVGASGLMRFYPLSASETRVDVSLSYLPRDTKLAEAFRALLARSNDQRLRSSLARAPEVVATAAEA